MEKTLAKQSYLAVVATVTKLVHPAHLTVWVGRYSRDVYTQVARLPFVPYGRLLCDHCSSPQLHPEVHNENVRLLK